MPDAGKTYLLSLDVEQEYYSRLEKTDVPRHLHGGLVRYVVHGLQPGHFLTAVLNNDLAESIKRADEDSAAGLVSLVRFLVNEFPYQAWGNTDRVENWLSGRRS
jgi:hypothetical protein